MGAIEKIRAQQAQMQEWSAAWVVGEQLAEICAAEPESERLVARRARGNLTGATQERINLKNAKLRLMRLMNANFRRGDYRVTLTFDRMLPAGEQSRELAKFFRRLRRLCRKRAGAELRYICVREDRRVRTHYHLVCGAFGVTVDELQALWGHGLVEIGTLDGNPDYGWLAWYLTKQEEGEKGRKRWSQSRNLSCGRTHCTRL